MRDIDELKIKDDQMSEEIKSLQRKAVIAKICMIGGFIGIAVCFITNHIPVAIACMALMIFGASNTKKTGESMKGLVGEGIVKQVVTKIFSEVNYDPFGYLDDRQIDSAEFDFPYNRSEGNDYVHGKYKDFDIEMSGLRLISVSHSDGHDHENSVFRGIWMICDFGRGFKANVSISEKNALDKLSREQGVETEDAAFNKQFRIISDNDEQALSFLSPKLREYIVATDAKSKKKTSLCFLKNGKLHIALDYGKQAFTVSGKSGSVDEIKAQFAAEIKVLTDIIDDIAGMDELFTPSF